MMDSENTDPMIDSPQGLPGVTVAPADFTRHNCSIRPVTPVDYDWILALWNDPLNLMTYRFGGIPPVADQLPQLLWTGVAAQFVITRAGRPREPLGLVSFYDRNVNAGHCGLALVLSAEARSTGWALSGAGIAIDHWFRVTRSNKIWLEVPEWNMASLGGLRLFGFVEEGCQRDQDWLDGRWWNRHLLALFRDRWDELRPMREAGLGASRQ